MKSIFSSIVMISLLVFAVSCNNGNQQENSENSGSVVSTEAPAQNGQPSAASQGDPQAQAANQSVDVANLPQVAQDFISQSFPGKEIAKIVADDDDYTVMLKSGEKLEFDTMGNIEEIEAYSGVPVTAIDNRIVDDVKTIDPQAVIVKLECNSNGGYEVNLNNGKEIKYSADCKRLMVENDD